MCRRLIRDYKRYILPFIASMVLALISTGLALFVPVLMGQGMDTIIGVGDVDFDSLFVIIQKMILAILISAISLWIMNGINNRIVYGISTDLRGRAFKSFVGAQYDYLDRDLLLTAAIFHDVGKLAELSPYPENDYTDAGQMLGHIVIGYNMLSNSIRKIDDFPKVKRNELLHCILAHHGEYEYGSPKKPSIAEAIALNFADDMDAKLETMKEVMSKVKGNDISWQGFNYLFDSNIRKTSEAYEE